MAVIKCEKCGTEYSDEANFCPNCGCPKNVSSGEIKEDNNQVKTNTKEKKGLLRGALGMAAKGLKNVAEVADDISSKGDDSDYIKKAKGFVSKVTDMSTSDQGNIKEEKSITENAHLADANLEDQDEIENQATENHLDQTEINEIESAQKEKQQIDEQEEPIILPNYGTMEETKEGEKNKTKISLKKHLTKKKIIGIAVVALILYGWLSSVICFHKWEDATCTKPMTCSKCHKVKGDPLGHKWIDATCTKASTCKVCGETKGDPLGHEISKKTIIKEATCVDAGQQEGMCSRCGEKVTEDIKPLGHEWGEWQTIKEPTCTDKGTKERTCSRCSEKEQKDSIDALGHDWADWTIIEKPTYSKEGKQTRICNRCKKQEDKSVPKLDINEVKKKMTTEQKNAYNAAKDYLDFSSFSKRGLIEQLSSEYGDGYTVEAATYAVEILEQEGAVDWYEQAERAAKEYLDFSSFSRNGLIEQLESEYGDKFTHEQAVEGVNRAYQ